MGARFVDHISFQGGTMADTVLNRNSKGGSMKYDCMKTGVVQLVLFSVVKSVVSS